LFETRKISERPLDYLLNEQKGTEFEPFFSVRNAVEQDFARCYQMAKKVWPEFKERESIYHIFCKHFNNTCFLAQDNGKSVGFLFGFLSQTETKLAYIHLVVTVPDYQRRGVATLLYERFFRTVKRLRRTHVTLIVNPDNIVSLNFHKKMGSIFMERPSGLEVSKP
jgi:ribosomal protein S18 acetylase RimI-like enzyme